MEIILLEKIRNLGDLGDTVAVANGYARNYLIPQKKAMRATEEAKVAVEERRRDLAVEEGKRRSAAEARAHLLPRGVRIERLAAENGKLYGSVSTADIAEALSSGDARIEKSEVALPDGPLKELGKSPVEVILHPEVRFSVLINVVAEVGQDGAGNADIDSDSADKADSADETDSADKADSAETTAPAAETAPPESADSAEAAPPADAESGETPAEES